MQHGKKNTANYATFIEGFSERLRKSRIDNALSMADLAKKIGLSSSSQISRYEAGENLPDVYTLFSLSKELNIDLHWLLTGQPAPISTIDRPTMKNALELFFRQSLKNYDLYVEQHSDEKDREKEKIIMEKMRNALKAQKWASAALIEFLKLE